MRLIEKLKSVSRKKTDKRKVFESIVRKLAPVFSRYGMRLEQKDIYTYRIKEGDRVIGELYLSGLGTGDVYLSMLGLSNLSHFKHAFVKTNILSIWDGESTVDLPLDMVLVNEDNLRLIISKLPVAISNARRVANQIYREER